MEVEVKQTRKRNTETAQIDWAEISKRVVQARIAGKQVSEFHSQVHSLLERRRIQAGQVSARRSAAEAMADLGSL